MGDAEVGEECETLRVEDDGIDAASVVVPQIDGPKRSELEHPTLPCGGRPSARPKRSGDVRVTNA